MGLGAGGAYLKLLKSDEQRSIPIQPELAAVLRKWRAACLEVCVKVGSDIGKTFVVGMPGVETPAASLPPDGSEKPVGIMNPATLSHKWRALMEWSDVHGALGEKPSFHNLRHTFAFMMANEMRMPVETLAKLLGHGNEKTTKQWYIAENQELEQANLREAMNKALSNGSMREQPAEVVRLKTGTDSQG